MSSTADVNTIAPAYPVVDFINPEQLKKDLAYTPVNLSDAFMHQASLFSEYGRLAAEASRQVDVIKLMLENTEAAVYQLLRNNAAATGDKVTEVMLEKQVTRHARVIGMKQALNEAKRIEAIGKTTVEAFRHRRDMLIQEGLKSRVEMQGEMRMNTADHNARMTQTLAERRAQRQADQEQDQALSGH